MLSFDTMSDQVNFLYNNGTTKSKNQIILATKITDTFAMIKFSFHFFLKDPGFLTQFEFYLLFF